MPELSVRRLLHDLRNDLSAIDLQAVYIGEIATEPEVRKELVKLREIIGQTAGNLRRVSQNLQPEPAPAPKPISAP